MKKILLTTISLYFFIQLSAATQEQELFIIKFLLNLDTAAPEEFVPPETIYRKNGILYCSGESYVAIENNNGAGLMQNGDFAHAAEIFHAGLKKAPLFFPFIYNLGKCYSHLMDYNKAFVYLNKARDMIPEYFLTYVEIGKTYESFNKFSKAIEQYRIAAKLNPEHIDTYIYLGNVYLKQNRAKAARKYYDAVLEKDPYYSNGLLGKARLQFRDKEYYKAFMTLKIIDTSDGYYDKAYHFYFAECAYKLRRYQIAYEQYTKMLEFKSDRFFLTTSFKLIEHKKELSKRFAEQEQLMKELQGN